MNYNKKIIIMLTVLMLAILPLFSASANTSQINDYGRNWDMKWHDINQFNVPITNFGIFGQNVETDNSGAYWPAGFKDETYIFGAGVWVGALVDTLITDEGDTLRDTLVSITYNPNSGASEFVPGDEMASSYEDPEDIVYISTSDNDGYSWPVKTDSGNDSIVSMQDSWCHYNDKDTSRHLSEENLPLDIHIIQTGYTWTGYLKEDIVFLIFDIINERSDERSIDKCFVGICTDNDIGNEAGTGNDLLGFIDTMTLDNGHDANGNEGVDSLNFINVGYQFQLEDETGWTHAPGVIAYKYLQSPIATEPVDIYHDGSVVKQPGEEIGMTSFRFFTLSTDPATKQERYQVLAGYDHLNFDPLNPEASFQPFPDTTVWGTGIDTLPGMTEDAERADDKRFMMTSGPFQLFYGDTARVIIAIMVAKSGNELLNKALAAQEVFDNNFIGPSAPARVDFSLKGLDNQVLLYWDNASEFVADKYYDVTMNSSMPNYAYREYDLEGYRIYRSKTGAGDSWDMIAQFDLINDISIELTDSTVSYDDGYNVVVDYVYETLGFNTGIPYFYIDTNLVNGITYYYQIRAYDFNYENYRVEGTDTIPTEPFSFEGSSFTQACIPRTVSTNYVSAYSSIMFDGTIVDLDGTEIVHPLDTTALKIGVYPVIDTMIDKSVYSDYKLIFTGVQASSIDNEIPAYTYNICALNSNGEEDLLYSGILNMQADSIEDENGNQIEIWINAPSSGFSYGGTVFQIDSFSLNKATWPIQENVEIEKNITGSYNDSIIQFEFASSPNNIYFHGSLWYKLIWHELIDSATGDVSLTLEVWDMQNEMEIPYGEDVGDCWHFNTTTNGDFPEYIDSLSGRAEASGMYFAGFNVFFNKTIFPQAMDWASRPQEGDEWEFKISIIETEVDSTVTADSTIVDTTITVVDPDFDMPPVGAEYSIQITPFEFTENTDSTLINIKTVPNPYVVRSEFDGDYRHRKMYFTNLPAECIIRIYTISGDLIKTINHSSEIAENQYDYTEGSQSWDVLTDNDQIPAAGIYLYQVETPDGLSKIGKFAIIK